ncbi:UNVERIFIED_CONTAM: hypothetical protein GTU68_007758 [Idotea baltica]|nr:hypothetical protein [Idotea baltica]
MARPASPMCLIQKIAKLAVQNFSRDPYKSKGLVGTELEQIKKLVSNITVSDLNIDPAILEDRGPFNPRIDKAPVTYMQIYEDCDVTICVFILKNGAKLPLHDHPEMNGILKVIHGSISVQSYTMKCNSPNKIIGNEKPFSGIYPAIKHPCNKVSSTDPPCPLSPESHNLHEIASVGGLAAFLDILSPPYGLDRRNGMERDCHYYEEIEVKLGENVENNCVYLESIPTPLEFWCDQTEYTGPPLVDVGLVTNGQSTS